MALNLLISKAGGGAKQTQKQILDSNPILEAFGNAKTLRNNNSSRFGKYMALQYDSGDQILGGVITKYLLEKSRCVYQAKGERNYHIFYQLCAGAGSLTAGQQSTLQLKPASQFHFLNQGGPDALTISGVDDQADWAEVVKALATIGVTGGELDELLKVLAAVMHLGEVAFEDGGDATANAEVSGGAEGGLATVAGLMGVDPAKMSLALLNRTMKTGAGGRGGRSGSVFKIPLKKAQAEQGVLALAKEMYNRLFTWMVARINCAIDRSAECARRIGVLDIFGFEVFGVNSLEQLLINYCNEKLHQQFLGYYFKLEMQQYADEGVSTEKIKFQDNAKVLSCLEKRGGVFSLLEDECNFPKGSDKSYVYKMHNALGSEPAYKKPKLAIENFVVAHFAGDVTYSSEGFMDKNRDRLEDDIELLLAEDSRAELLKDLWIEGMPNDLRPGADTGLEGGAGRKKGKATTVATRFKQQLDSLVGTLNVTDPWYIRCVKPNERKAAQDFDGRMTLAQLRYSGMLDSIKIRQAGYAVRFHFTEFASRYGIIVAAAKAMKPGTELQQVKLIAKYYVDHSELENGDFAVGKSKIFFKEQESLLYLNRLLDEFLGMFAVRIQSRYRGFRKRKLFKSMRWAVKAIQARYRLWKGMGGAGMRGPGVEGPLGEAGKVIARYGRAYVMRRMAKRIAEWKREAEAGGASGEALEQAVTERLKAHRAGAMELRARTTRKPVPRAAVAKPDDKKKPVRRGRMGVRSGWLLKRAKAGDWRERFFVLTANRLAYFTKGDGADVLKGDFRLGDCELREVSADSEELGLAHLVSPSERFSSVLVVTSRSKRRTLVVAAATDADRAEWTQAIREADAEAKKASLQAVPFRATLFSGWLLKASHNSDRWHHRFFLLRDGLLSYYADDSCKAIKGEMTLTVNCTVDAEDTAQLGLPSEHEGRPVVPFVLRGDGSRSLRLGAPTEEAASGWVDALECAVEEEEGLAASGALGVAIDLGEATLREGWLLHRTSGGDADTQSWVRVFAVLTMHHLSLYSGEDCVERTAALELATTTCTQGDKVTGMSAEVEGAPDKLWTFEAKDAVEVKHELAAASEDAAFSWRMDTAAAADAAARESAVRVAPFAEGWVALSPVEEDRAAALAPNSETNAGWDRDPLAPPPTPPAALPDARAFKVRWVVVVGSVMQVYRDSTKGELLSEFNLAGGNTAQLEDKAPQGSKAARAAGVAAAANAKATSGPRGADALLVHAAAQGHVDSGAASAAACAVLQVGFGGAAVHLPRRTLHVACGPSDALTLESWREAVESAMSDAAYAARVEQLAKGDAAGAKAAAAAATARVRQGWVLRESRTLDVWRRRYAVLEAGFLRLYKSEEMGELVAEHDLCGAEVSAVPDGDVARAPGVRPGAAFAVATADPFARLVRLVAPDGREAEEWRMALVAHRAAAAARRQQAAAATMSVVRKDTIAVALPDGRVLELPVDGALTAAKVSAAAADEMALNPATLDGAVWAVIEEDAREPGLDVRVLERADAVADVVDRWAGEVRLLLEHDGGAGLEGLPKMRLAYRMLLAPPSDALLSVGYAPGSGNCAATYCQLAADLRWMPLPPGMPAHMAALRAQSEVGDVASYGADARAVEAVLTSRSPPAPGRRARGRPALALDDVAMEAAMEQWHGLEGTSSGDAALELLETLAQSALFGACYFRCSDASFGEGSMLAVGRTGMFVVQHGRVIRAIFYENIARWGFSSRRLRLELDDESSISLRMQNGSAQQAVQLATAYTSRFSAELGEAGA